MNWKDFSNIIVGCLTDDLLDKKFRKLKKIQPDLPKTFGHCYIASEAAYHLLGGKEEGWKPMFVRHLGCPHWFLKHESGFILDLTADQFKTSVDYNKGRGTGFLTKEPSKRTKTLIKRIDDSALWGLIKITEPA